MIARQLFAGLGAGYERWAAVLSLGQDRRWRQAMIESLDISSGQQVLDVAAGTGSITRDLRNRGADVVSLDQSPHMLTHAVERGATAVVATGERLPFPDSSFDAVTFGYLLRYVDDVGAALEELTRVLRSEGKLGMVEFGRPKGIWRVMWWIYTRTLLPVAARLAGRSWRRVASFLGPNIDRFVDTWPPERLISEWGRVGLTDVSLVEMSMGGGVVMTARKP